MAVITVYGKTPDVGSAAFVAPNATLAGDVVLAAGSSVWYGAVVRGDTGAIRIGKNSNIQDNAVLHTGPNLGVTIGKNVSIGHSAVVHGCTVASATYPSAFFRLASTRAGLAASRTLAGTPMATMPSGTTVFSSTSAPAATTAFLPTTAL